MRVSRIVSAGLTLLSVSAALLAIGYGCGSSEPPAADYGGGPNPGAGGGIGVLTGPCDQEGKTVACHLETGRNGNIVNCFSGTQTCINGEWGPCGGSGTLSTVIVPASFDEGSGGLKIQTVTSSDASAAASGCKSNPCNPYCLGIDTDAGALTLEGGITTVTILGSTEPLGQYPNPKQAANCNFDGGVGATNCTCIKGVPPKFGDGGLNYDECNYDYCCASAGGVGSAGACVPWLDPSSSNCLSAAPSPGGAVPVAVTGYAGIPSTQQQQVKSCISTSIQPACKNTKGDGGAVFYDPTPNCDDCNYDMHCIAGDGGTCQQWGNSAYNADAGGVDLQLDYPCFDTASVADTFHVPVCNRGSASLTVTPANQIKVGLYVNTPVSNAARTNADCVVSKPNPPDDWTIYYPTNGSTTLAPGGCVDINYNNASLTGPFGTVKPGDLTKAGEYLAVNWDGSLTEVNYCNNWNNGSNALCTTPYNGVDYTIGIGCADVNNNLHYPVCNRGTADSPASGYLLLVTGTGNPPAAASSAVCAAPTPIQDTCIIDLSVNPLKAGTCVGLDVAAAGSSPSTVPGMVCSGIFTGNRSIFVNPPSGTPVPNTGNPKISTLYGATTWAQRRENDYCNNWSFDYVQGGNGTCQSYGQQPPAPSSTAYKYTASCLPGYKATWNQFAYNTSVPSQSDVLFTATTQAVYPDGGLGPTTPVVTLADPGAADAGTIWPAVCPMSGPSPCPLNLATLLGANASNTVLNLSVVLTSTTAVPTANSWSVTYSCVPNE